MSTTDMIPLETRRPRTGLRVVRTDTMADDEHWFAFWEKGSFWEYGEMTGCGMRLRREMTNVVAWRNLTKAERRWAKAHGSPTHDAMVRERNTLRDRLSLIDAVPEDTRLPSMPGFDREYVDGLLLEESLPYTESSVSRLKRVNGWAQEWLDALPNDARPAAMNRKKTTMTMAEALRDLMFERAKEGGHDPYDHLIWQGDPDLLQSAFIRAKGRQAHTHALNDMDAVMASVRRSPLFKRVGVIPAHSRTGMAKEVRYAAYSLVGDHGASNS